MSILSIHIDESGNLNLSNKQNTEYRITLVFHNQAEDISSAIVFLDNKLRWIGLDVPFIHTTSYGGMVSGQSEEDFFSGASMPRNRELMRIFKDLDLVEQLGSGMNRILRSYDRSIFRISKHFIRVAFPFAESPNENDPRNRTDETVDDTENETVNDTVQKRVKDIICRVPAATYQYIAEKSGVSRATVARAIKHMVEVGEIKREGTDRKGSWRILK